MASCRVGCTNNFKIHYRTVIARPKGKLTRLEVCNLKYLKPKKYDHPHMKIKDFAEITQGGLPLLYVLCTDLYMSDSGSRSPWGILEGWACTEARLPQPQERQGETGTHFACPWQVGKGAKQPLLGQLPGCRPQDASHPQRCSWLHPYHHAWWKEWGGGKPSSLLAAASHSRSPLPSPTAGPQWTLRCRHSSKMWQLAKDAVFHRCSVAQPL